MPAKNKRIGRGTDPDFYMEVAKGNVSGHSIVNKFGENPSLVIGSSYEDIWHGGLTYEGMPAGTTGKTIDIFSSSTADDAGAGGARTIELQGLSTTYAVQTETMTLNGTALVSSTNNWTRMNRGIVKTAGSSGSNIGDITAQHTGTTDRFMKLPAGHNQTMISCYTIPGGKTGYITDWHAGVGKAAGAVDINCRLLARPSSGVFNVKEEMAIRGGGNSQINRVFTLPKGPFTEKTDIKIAAVTDTTDMPVQAGFGILLVDNT